MDGHWRLDAVGMLCGALALMLGIPTLPGCASGTDLAVYCARHSGTAVTRNP
jgi:hypothetical protein